MIEHLRSYQGYCGQCNEPGPVGEYRLHGWASVFNLCADCLTKLIERQKGNNANG